MKIFLFLTLMLLGRACLADAYDQTIAEKFCKETGPLKIIEQCGDFLTVEDSGFIFDDGARIRVGDGSVGVYDLEGKLICSGGGRLPSTDPRTCAWKKIYIPKCSEICQGIPANCQEKDELCKEWNRKIRKIKSSRSYQ